MTLVGYGALVGSRNAGALGRLRRGHGYRPTDDELLDILLPVVVEYGCGAVTVDQITDTGQVTKQTLYAHFGSKDGMLSRLVGREAALMRAIFDEVSSPEKIDVSDLATYLTGALEPFFKHAAARSLGMRLLADPTAPQVPGFDKQVLADAVARVMAAFHFSDAEAEDPATHQHLLVVTMAANAVMSGVLTAIAHDIDPALAVKTCAAFIAAGATVVQPATSR
ncbi:TetR/AcrR family transcriptional regulator [Mycobacteroides stephanolepidis]|uniref:TetR/AcrR family transcriptional regulator n=1 Tax=[Mycobacterium] stephanolepidis TaxID=1520670 RepID=UPI00139043C7|nr:TetR/AcrR family transcriptional regulator [[Mycobacterium] stephanolepidis]